MRQAIRPLPRFARRRFAEAQTGTVAIMTALLFPVLVGGMALGAEASYWYLSQRKLQQASDLAAYAAAVELRSGRSDAEMADAAHDMAVASAFRDGQDTLAISHPPASGVRAGNANAVEVTLARQQVRFFTLIYSDDAVDIGARAVAEVRGGGDACLLTLDPTVSGAVKIAGSSEVTFDGCDVATNSNSNTAFDMQGGAANFTAGCIHSVGGVSLTSNVSLTTCSAPNTEAPVIMDPYADLPEPVFNGISACVNLNLIINVSLGITLLGHLPDGTPVRMMCNPSIKGTVDFPPGLYILRDDFAINGGAKVTGDDVTFFLTNGAKLKFNGSATIDLSAPATGRYKGILFFGDRDDVGVAHSINGTASSRLNGAIYLPSSDLDYSGNYSGASGCTQVVVRRMTFSGNSSLTVNCSAAGTRRIAVDQTIALVE